MSGEWLAQTMRGMSILGMAILILAYVMNQKGRLLPTSRIYLLCNACGAFMLALYSVYIREWVFVVLEGFWCIASLLPLGARRT